MKSTIKKKLLTTLKNVEFLVDQNKKIPPKQILTLHLGKLDTPITTGRELLSYLEEHLNTKRYDFRKRGRGSRPRGYVSDLPIDMAEKVAIYSNEKSRIAKLEQEFYAKERSRWQVCNAVFELKKRLKDHAERFENDFVIREKQKKKGKNNER